MKFLADLHIHSPFSRATSRESNLAGLFAWARVKGIQVIGTGDFTHPAWLQQLKENLTPAEPGFYRLKDEQVPPAFAQAAPQATEVRFILTVEISSIYKRHGRVRKVHNLLFAPDFAAVERLNRRLAAIGNIESDGRPILGLDSRDLLEIMLTEIPDGFLVPAHIWTPWFSLFGSKSGFDSIEECFGDLAPHIFALETGLSSDPDMNRLVSALDRFTLISNSDCHSPAKLGREVNLFDCDFDFFSLKKALRDPGQGFAGTIEFFPEEGKYHLDGHRSCKVCLAPLETRKLKGICPVCGRALTIGVSHRVLDLADRDTPLYPPGAPVFRSLIPLPEVIGEILDKGPTSKGVMAQYQKAVNRFGSEFNLFLQAPAEELNAFSPLLAEAVSRIRAGKVTRQGGFDGQFGVIRAFREGELDRLRGQASLFGDPPRLAGKAGAAPTNDQAPPPPPLLAVSHPATAGNKASGTNPEQQLAVESRAGRILVAAGPGTGKTHTLVRRLIYLLQERAIDPARIFAITFTNRAADEMHARLTSQADSRAEQVFVGTFHRFCLEWLREKDPELTVLGADEREILVARLFAHKTSRERKDLSRRITAQLLASENAVQPEDAEVTRYLRAVEEAQRSIDLEGIIPHVVQRLKNDAPFGQKARSRVGFLLVDEFQDVNRAQFELVSWLAESCEIFVIGDPNQAIYGFRGSDLQFFFQFAKARETNRFALTRNYRSGAAILEAATAVINHNRLKGESRLAPQRGEPGELTLYPAATAKAEAEQVVKEIEKILGGISSFSLNSGRSRGEVSELSFRDIGVLYRLGRQADELVEALGRRGIPFQIIGSQPFFMAAELRALSFFTLTAAKAAGLADFLALCRLAPGIGQGTVARLEKQLRLNSPDFFPDSLQLQLPAQPARALRDLQASVARFRLEAEHDLPRAYLPVFELFGLDPEAAAGRRFIALAGALGMLAAFARHLAENAQAAIYDDRAEAVSLMTLHGAKGLEFPVVFIIGAADGLLPCRAPGCDLEEERRLFYVGLTRAREKLLLSYARPDNPSPFLAEIPTPLLKIIRPEAAKRRKPAAKQLKLF